MTDIDPLVEYLSQLKVGERSWFWFCPEASSPLIMTSFADPAGMDALLEQSKTVSIPFRAQVCTGMAAVTSDGTMQFASPLFRADMLAALSQWVQDNIDNHQGLAYLSQSKFVRISISGQVQERFENQKLWSGIELPHRVGTLNHSADALATLEASEEAWMWMSEASAQADAIVICIKVAEDPKGEAFGAQVLAGRMRSASKGAGLRGVVSRLSHGAFLLHTRDDLSAVGSKLQSWLEQQGEIRVVRVRKEEVIASLRIGGADLMADLSIQSKALEDVLAGEKRFFWFTNKSKAGTPILLIEDSGTALKAAAKEVDSGAASVRGKLGTAKWGIEFRARNRYPTFLQELALWVEEHHSNWPKLLHLVDARMTLRNKEGEVLDRFKDKEAWAKLSEKRR